MDDKNRLTKILEILPEKTVRNIVDELANGQINNEFMTTIDECKEYFKDTLSEFSNVKINGVAKNFSEALNNLNKFLLTHFFRVQLYPESIGFGLYPEWRYDQKKSKMWHKHFENLQSLAEGFLEKYKILIKTANEHLYEKNEKENHELGDEVFTPKLGIRSDIYLDEDRLRWGEKSIPMQRGQKQMMEKVLKNAREIRGGKRPTKKGNFINREVFQSIYGGNQGSFRNALNKIRGKIKKAKFPMKIKSETTNNYILEIHYPKKSDRK